MCRGEELERNEGKDIEEFYCFYFVFFFTVKTNV